MTAQETRDAYGWGVVYVDKEGRRWRVNGKMKTWKRSPDHFEIPVKYGLWGYGYITEQNCEQFTLEER